MSIYVLVPLIGLATAVVVALVRLRMERDDDLGSSVVDLRFPNGETRSLVVDPDDIESIERLGQTLIERDEMAARAGPGSPPRKPHAIG